MQKTTRMSRYELVLKPLTISFTPRFGTPERGWKRLLVWSTGPQTIVIDVLIVTYIHGTHPLALWVALNTRMGPPRRP